MSAKHVYTLFCDACSAQFPTVRILVQEARDEAAATGWRYVVVPPSDGRKFARSMDFCGACNTLAKFEGSEPSYRGGKKPTGQASHEVPLEKAFMDALTSQAPV